MTVVCQGPFGGSEPTAQGDMTGEFITPQAGDTSFDLKGRLSQWRGVKQIFTTPSYASAHYTKDYDPELAAKALKPFAKGTIGYVGTYQMSYAMLDYIKRTFPNARYVDASDMVDRIKVIKSAEEMELVKRAALMQDGAMRAAFAAVKPGMRDTEVAAVAQHYSQCHGSENGIYLCASMPLGTPSKFANRHLQNRVIQKGDQIALLVEDNGPGGMYTELGRSCVVGAKVPQAMKDELAFCMESRKLTLDLLKPGTSCKDIWDAFNAFMRKNGRPMEARLYCHGQGYDLVERPLIRNDEPMTIEKDMNIVVHPTYIHARLSQLAVRQLSDRRQRTGRPAAPVSGRDRRGGLAIPIGGLDRHRQERKVSSLKWRNPNEKNNVAAAFASVLALTGSAGAQNFPTHPVTMVIPFAAGGPQDTIGRIIAQRMGELLGQTVVIENVGGAGGMTGSKRVADAKPDGYTMILGSVGTHAQNQTLYKHPLYNVVTDFTPVAYLAETPIAIITRPGPAGEQLQGIHRLRQGQPGQDAIRLGRRRLGDASRLRRARQRDGHENHPCALQGHRPGDAGPDRRPHRLPVRDHRHRQAADRRRQGERHRDHDQGSLAGAAESCRPPANRASTCRPTPGARCSCRRARPPMS